MKKINFFLLLVILSTSFFVTNTKAEDLLFSVQLTADTPLQNTPSGESKVSLQVGDTITFTRHIESSGVVNNSWKWNHDSNYLDCAAYPEFDSPNFKCTVLKEGQSIVSITMYPVMTDGSKRVITSNVVFVTAEEDSEELLFSVKLTADSTLHDTPSGESAVFVFVGKTITFTRNIESSGVVNNSWKWNHDSNYLDCAAYPEFDSPNFKCAVLKEGKSVVSITMYPVMNDGSKRVVTSNVVFVTAEEDSLACPGSCSIPPAGYEDEVLTKFNVYTNPFPDTNIEDLSGQAAAELYRRAVIGGFPDGEFKGNREVNRAETAKFLLLARYGSVEEIANNDIFSDVLNGEWYVKYVVKAAKLGIINGYPDKTFRPADTVNTAEFLKMLSLTFGLDLNLSFSYVDVNSEDWFSAYAGIAEKYELFPHLTNYLSPDHELSREAVSIAIFQYLRNR